jgi:predicted Fe-Mo cluster-binding NifX family protein
MKIAVSATGPGLDDPVDPRLGRCTYLIFVDPDTMEFESLENRSNALSGGAGIQTARTIAEGGAAVVLTGNCGPNAHQTLTAAGIRVFTGMSGTVRDALGRYERGEAAASPEPTVPSHAGLGAPGPFVSQPGPGMRGGRGCGGGMGRGSGRGRGQGLGMRSGPRSGPPAPSPDGPPDEKAGAVSALRKEAEQMTRRLEEITERLRALERP